MTFNYLIQTMRPLSAPPSFWDDFIDMRLGLPLIDVPFGEECTIVVSVDAGIDAIERLRLTIEHITSQFDEDWSCSRAVVRQRYEETGDPFVKEAVVKAVFCTLDCPNWHERYHAWKQSTGDVASIDLDLAFSSILKPMRAA
jgi:hypothetical protein